MPEPRPTPAADSEERSICFKCLRPASSCYCKYISPVESGIKFIFLMHPKESRRQRTGTGRLAHLSLPQSEILVGIDFSRNERLNELLCDPKYFPLLLYPAPDALVCGSENFKSSLSGRIPLVVIIDSTWSCSKKMMRLSENIKSLPKLSFAGQYKSIFTFKREPKEYCVSTIESCYYLIREMQDAGLSAARVSPEPLMNVFRRMIKFQLQKENDRIQGLIPNMHATDWKYTKKKEVPEFLNEGN